MENNIIWFDRKFKLDIAPEMYPIVVERLRGVPVRLEEKLSGVSEDVLTINPDGWSAKRQIGHLIIVEGLWMKRVENYKNKEKHLFAADLKNTKTEEIDYDSIESASLLKQFRDVRKEYVTALDSLDKDEVEQIALHPRLNLPMRLIDSAYFSAEHDEHHMSRIHDLILKYGK